MTIQNIRHLRSLCLLCALCGFAFLTAYGPADAHKFYVSVSKVKWNAEGKRLDLSIRIFTDDLERAIEHNGGPTLKLWTDEEHAESDRFLSEYITARLHFSVNDRQAVLEYIGKADALDATACMFQIQNVDSIRSIEVDNMLLLDILDEQTNIVRFDIDGKKKILNLNKQVYKDRVEF